MANEFTEAGLFDYIKTRYLEDLEMSSDAFEYIDATSQGYRLIIELKCRQVHYDELILEKDKHDSLGTLKRFNVRRQVVGNDPLDLLGYLLAFTALVFICNH